MKTIVPAKEVIAQLWGSPKPKDTAYRLMKYLLKISVEDGLLLHNNVTGHLIFLTNKESALLSALPAKPTEDLRELIANHFLVPEDYDEYSSVKQLRKIYQRRDTGDSINHYVILPTSFCNAHCFYCYESDYPRVHMSEETAGKLVDFIAEHRKGMGVVINWFGGEPLVGIRRIDQISQALKDRGIPYTSSMISNGYLFDEEIVNRCVDLWKMTRIQITLDGTETVYNQVKAYADAEGSPFQRVLRNIDLLADKGIRVNIRLNIGVYNIEDIRVLIEELGKRYSENDHVTVYLSMLYDGKGFEPVSRPVEDTVRLLKIMDEFTERLIQLQLHRDKWKVPSLEVKQCIADSPHAIVIQPDGSFCRCEHENILDSYGNLDQGVLDRQKPGIWKEIIEKTDHCAECPLYPNCYTLRHCINGDRICNEALRSRLRTEHQKHLLLTYNKSMEESENERVYET